MYRSLIIFLASAAAYLFIGFEASATPFVDVRAVWGIHSTPAIPSGVSVACTGEAAQGTNGCSAQAILQESLNHGGAVFLSEEAAGSVIFTNNSSEDIAGWLTFVLSFSAFNPGGSWIGAGVTDPAFEFAAFSSTVSYANRIYDSHSCATSSIQPVCGVMAPDESYLEWWILGLDAGASIEVPFKISISAELRMVPEADSLVLLLPPVVAMLTANRRRKQVMKKSWRSS